MSKNKYFDKHPLVKDLIHCLTGESILFAETTQDWKESRQALTPAFYKGQLEKLTEIAKQAISKTVERHRQILAKSGNKSAVVDVIKEVNDMMARILLICAFGVDFADKEVDFWVDGKLEKRTVGLSLVTTFNSLINRIAVPHVTLFPYLANVFITRHERDTKRNAIALRKFCLEIIDNKEKEMRENPELKQSGDFLTLILKEEFFKNKKVRILDECLTFFFAGSQTSATAT